jgi:CSLREA domain-containing protein
MVPIETVSWQVGRRMSAANNVARRWICGALLALTMPMGVVLTPAVSHATIIFVTTLSDSSKAGDRQCSLREAINNANAGGTDTTKGDCAIGTGADTIRFKLGGTITLTSSLPSVVNALAIEGRSQIIFLDGAHSFRVLSVEPSAVLDISDLTIMNGNAGASGGGGAVDNQGFLNVGFSEFTGNSAGVFGGAILNDNAATLSVTDSNFFNNSSGGFGGGAIYSDGPLTISNSTFSGNTTSLGNGGALYNSGGRTMSVTSCTFSNNSAFSAGAGIENHGNANIGYSLISENSAPDGGGIDNNGTLTVAYDTFANNTVSGDGAAIQNAVALTVSGSTFVDNTSTSGDGGGVYNFRGTATITNCTFDGNNAAIDGGGVFTFGTMNVNFCTFADNTGGSGGAAFNGGGLTLANSIFAGISGNNCASDSTAINDGGFNISDDATCGFGTSTGDNGDTIGDNVDPLLDPAGLQHHGGPTLTIALQENSPAIGAIPSANCIGVVDQRGAPRPVTTVSAGPLCDIGAVESENTVWISPVLVNFGAVKVGQTSPPVVITLSNGTIKKDAIKGFAIGPDFQLESNNCTSSLAAGQSCNYEVSFQPLQRGNKHQQLQVTIGGSTQTVKLRGVAKRVRN